MAGKYLFKLRFNKKAIPKWAELHPVEYDAEIENTLAPQATAGRARRLSASRS